MEASLLVDLMPGITIQLKRGQASAWTAVNPILAQGEVGLELDTGKFKFGDGSTRWNSLAYVSTGSASAQVSYGHGAPAFTPSTTSAIYFDQDTGTQYNYYAGAWH